MQTKTNKSTNNIFCWKYPIPSKEICSSINNNNNNIIIFCWIRIWTADWTSLGLWLQYNADHNNQSVMTSCTMQRKKQIWSSWIVCLHKHVIRLCTTKTNYYIFKLELCDVNRNGITWKVWDMDLKFVNQYINTHTHIWILYLLSKH